MGWYGMIENVNRTKGSLAMAKEVVKVLSAIFWIASAVIAALARFGERVGTASDDVLLAGVLALVALSGISVSGVL